MFSCKIPIIYADPKQPRIVKFYYANRRVCLYPRPFPLTPSQSLPFSKNLTTPWRFRNNPLCLITIYLPFRNPPFSNPPPFPSHFLLSSFHSPSLSLSLSTDRCTHTRSLLPAITLAPLRRRPYLTRVSGRARVAVGASESRAKFRREKLAYCARTHTDSSASTLNYAGAAHAITRNASRPPLLRLLSRACP